MNTSAATHPCHDPPAKRAGTKIDVLDKAVALAKKVGAVFIATANVDGLPHLAAAGEMEKIGPENISISEWFCPGTVKNLRQNGRISVVVWEKEADMGYQLIGTLTDYKNVGILNGYAPGIEGQIPRPQLERRLCIHVQAVVDFSVAPHSDVEEI